MTTSATGTHPEPPSILVIVTGGIAAYKAAELVRELRRGGARVRVAMTEGAQAFVAPLTFQALSGARVATHLLDPEAEAAMGHIELARWPDRIVVAPASADFLARMAHGLADDLPSTLCLATTASITVAPAMNRQMWAASATQANVATLRDRGVTVIGPAAGDQACGEVGEGRMVEAVDLAHALLHGDPTGGPVPGALSAEPLSALSGRRVVVTAGPTREAIDPVRYLTNRSSGRMGFAVAEAARHAGAEVTLIAGPCSLPTPPGVRRVDVESAEAMARATRTCLRDGVDVFIGAAAVADYRVAEVASQKMKKGGGPPRLVLTPTVDILQEVAALDGSSGVDRPFTVGFAAETERVVEHAREKMARKHLDLIAANRVGPDAGFDREDNRLHLLWPGGERELPEASKAWLARALIECIAERMDTEHGHH